MYQWWDGPVQSQIYHTPNTGSSETLRTAHVYKNVGGTAELQFARVDDGRARTVAFRSDLSGQIIKRDEGDLNSWSGVGSTQNGDPHEIYYRFNGKLMGYAGNNGTLDTDYAKSIDARTATQGNGAFRNGTTNGASHVDFDQSVAPLTSYFQGSAMGSYTARAGDTLASVAAQLWGDASLWYKLAEANGLSGASTLIEGQLLAIPAGVVKSTHNANTFTPYDQSEVLGETLPTTPRAPKKNNCGMFGTIVLVIIAVIVSIYATEFAGPIWEAALGESAAASVAAGATGAAAGSVASQSVGVATGIQEKFSWNAVALAAVGGAVGASGIGNFAGGAVGSAMVNNALTQGIGYAMGWQDAFSWAGVAAAGVAAGVGHALGGDKLAPLYGKGANPSLGNIAAHLGVASARSIAYAATRSALEGSDFDENLRNSIPDVIGQTIGESIAGGIGGASSQGQSTAQGEQQGGFFSAIGDFLGFDGQFGWQGPEGRSLSLGQFGDALRGGGAIKVEPLNLPNEILMPDFNLEEMAALPQVAIFGGRFEFAPLKFSENLAKSQEGSVAQSRRDTFAIQLAAALDVNLGGWGADRSAGYPGEGLPTILDLANLGDAELILAQSSGRASGRLPSEFTPLENLALSGRDSSLLNALEGIARRYGPGIDATARRTGQVWERGGIVGTFNGQPAISRVYTSSEEGEIDLAGMRRDLVRSYPGFEPLYDWHFHSSAGISTGDGRTSYGFSPGDLYFTAISPLRGSFVLMPDRILFVTRAEAARINQGPDAYYAHEGTVLRQWRTPR